jgi:diguanylate cyclase (GGDEF)-like protein
LDKPDEMLRTLERVAAEHLEWRGRVQAALMFPGRGEPPGEGAPAFAELRTLASDRLALLLRLHDAMRSAARALLACGRPDPDGYRGFLDAVEAYEHEARRVEKYCHRVQTETDPLTGLWNRQGMMRDLRRERARAARSGRPACLAIADLDHFKQVNDSWGHGAGDRVLCLAARFFQRRLRGYDMVYRYGGEEFLFCLPDTDCDSAHLVLVRLCGLMGRVPITLDDGTRLTVTCSIGMAEMSAAPSVQAAVEAADHALYRAKAAGRNRVMVAVENQRHPCRPIRQPAPAQVEMRG